jgi:hypothetical protein
MRYLMYQVYKPSFGDCSNGGVTSRHNKIFVQCEDGPFKPEDVPTDLRFIIDQRSSTYFAAIPENINAALCGPMYGGCLAATSDSRAKNILHIHDRFETWDQYDALSR